MIPIKVPSVGESVTSGVLGAWKVKDGDYVKEGEPLLEIETEKITSEVVAERAGAVRQFVVAGAEIKTGETVGEIDETAGAPGVAPVATPVSRPPVVEPKPPVEERTTRRKMSPLRQKIAARLVAVRQETAMLTTFNEADMSNVNDLRTKYQERFVARHGVKLGFMSFFVKAAVHALKAVPAVNARIDGDEIVENKFYDIGIAISTEKGLVVPVLRDAERASLADIELAVKDYARKARDGKITIPDLEGGVFTITNGGVFGSLLSTPLLNPPQSAILGMHAVVERPVAVAGQVAIRPMMYLALSYDHRLVDGKQAVTFLGSIKEYIENPGEALLDL